MAQRVMDPEVILEESPEGGSGVALFGGMLFRNEDYNPDLQGQKGTLVYEKMRRGDPDVASGLAKLIWPLLAVNWEFEPGEDTEQGREIAAFCAKWIFGDGRRDPFAMNRQAFLRHALLMLSDGFSAFEKVWGRDRDGRDVYAQLVPILPKTIIEFKFSEVPGGGLEYAKQRAYVLGKGYTDAKIRAEKLGLFVFGREGDNLFGWPILRAAYKPWVHKETIEIVDGIRIERNGIGFTVITIPKGAKKNVREAAKNIASQIRVHERQGIIVEEGTTVQILYPTGSDPKIVESLNFLRSQILQVLMSEFVEHGTSSVGSNALVGSKIGLQLYSVQGLASDTCDGVNRGFVPELVWRNWGPNTPLPTCKCDEIARMTAVELADIVSKMSASDFLDADPEVKQHVRKLTRFPLIPEKDMKRLREAHDKALDMKVEMAGQPPVVPGVAPDAEDDDKPPKIVPIPKAAARLLEGALQPATLRRELYEHERHVDFAMTKAYLQSEPKRLWTLIEPMRGVMVRKAAARLVAMTDAELRGGSVAIPLKRKLSEKLEEPFLAIYVRGRKSVLADRARQFSKPMVAESDDDEDDDFNTEPTAKQWDWIKTLVVAGFVSSMMKAMEKRGIEEAVTVRQAELGSAEQQRRIEKALADLSENVILRDLAKEINRAYQSGRDEQAKAMAGEVVTCFYSAVMDDGTEQCAEQGGLCSELDGDEHELGDPRYEAPSPFCAYPANCRCETVYVFREEAA